MPQQGRLLLGQVAAVTPRLCQVLLPLLRVLLRAVTWPTVAQLRLSEVEIGVGVLPAAAQPLARGSAAAAAVVVALLPLLRARVARRPVWRPAAAAAGRHSQPATDTQWPTPVGPGKHRVQAMFVLVAWKQKISRSHLLRWLHVGAKATTIKQQPAPR